MTKYIVGLIVLIVIAGGMLLPTFQSVRESNCGQRDPVESVFFELERGSTGPPKDVAMLEQSNTQSQVSSWPSDVAGLVKQLNEWYRDELILYNEPEAFPNQNSSGETGGWISSHIEELKKLGADVNWDKLQKKYVIVKEK